MRRLSECITRIRDWMACNRLKLNEDKTQAIWLGTRHQLSKVTTHGLTLPNVTVQFSGVVNDLGVLLNSQLTMADHVAALSRSCFFQLRQLRSIKQSLSLEATTKLVHAFISSRLDYCNSLLVGVTGQMLHRLQVIQNATARLVTGATRYEHMTPVLRNLHWLPVRHRITFKTAVTVYKCLHGLAPPYLTEYYTSTSLLVVVTCDLPTLASSSFHAQGQVTATVVSAFMVPSCRILCYTTQLTYLWPHSEID